MTRAEAFEYLTTQMNELYRRKNADYGGAFTLLRERHPQSILIRLWDKLLRLEQLMQTGYTAQVEEEKIEDTLLDLANYAVMELTERMIDAQTTLGQNDAAIPHTELEMSRRGTARWEINPDGYYPYCSACKKEPPDRVMRKICPGCGRVMENPDNLKS